MERLTLRQFIESALGGRSKAAAPAPAPTTSPARTTSAAPRRVTAKNASPIVNRGMAVQRRSERIPDVMVTNQRGEKKRFRTDLVEGKKVMLGFIYTRCEGICPLTTHNMRRVHELLEDEFGAGFQMICLSLDPKRDSAKDLADYARQHRAELPGWDFVVAANEEETTALRRAVGAYETDPALDQDITQHSGVLIFGNDRTDRWMGLGAGSEPEIIAKSFIRTTREGAIARLSRDSGPGVPLAAQKLNARMRAKHEDPACDVGALVRQVVTMKP